MARAAPFMPLLSQWLDRMLPSARRGALSSAAHAAPRLGKALRIACTRNLGRCPCNATCPGWSLPIKAPDDIARGQSTHN